MDGKLNNFAYVRLSVVFALLFAGGCGGGGKPEPIPSIPGEEPIPVLERVGSEDAARFKGEEGRRQFEKASKLMRQGAHGAAIREFNRLIPLEAPILAEGELPDYDSLDHEACAAISECYERLGDVKKALDFAKLARDRYRFYSAAGSTVKAREMMLAERITRLENQPK